MKKRVVILGAGESGTGAAILAKKQGNEVFVSDLSAISEKYKQALLCHIIDFEEGQHTEELIMNAAFVVKSPGIPDKAPIIKKLKYLIIAILVTPDSLPYLQGHCQPR